MNLSANVLYHSVGLARATGWFAAANILARRALKNGRTVSVRLPGLKTELEVNPTDSDPLVLSQIFGWLEYFPGEPILARLRAISQQWAANGIRPIIIDGGANVGYSSIYLSFLFPEATVLAVEPDRDSFQTLCGNCRAWRMIQPVHGALWENDRGVLIQKGDHGSWASHVGKSGKFVPSFTLDSLRKRNDRLLILKLDIEGAEREVIAASPELVRSAMLIMIEPHDWMRPGSCGMGPLFRALADQHFDLKINGENLFLFSPEIQPSRCA